MPLPEPEVVEPKPKMVEFSARIPVDLYDRFITHFPQFGSTTWAINALLTELMDQLESSPSTSELVGIAANRVKHQTREIK